VNELLTAAGGQPEIAAKKRKRRINIGIFAVFVLFRGYFMA